MPSASASAWRSRVERRSTANGASASPDGPPWASQAARSTPGHVGVLERGGQHEPPVGGVLHGAVRQVVAAGDRGQGAAAYALDDAPRADLETGRPGLAQLGEPLGGQRRHPRVVPVGGAVEHLAGQPCPALARDRSEVAVGAAEGAERVDVLVLQEVGDPVAPRGCRPPAPRRCAPPRRRPGCARRSFADSVVIGASVISGVALTATSARPGSSSDGWIAAARPARSRSAIGARNSSARLVLICSAALRSSSPSTLVASFGLRRHEQEVEVGVVRHRHPEVDRVLGEQLRDHCGQHLAEAELGDQAALLHTRVGAAVAEPERVPERPGGAGVGRPDAEPAGHRLVGVRRDARRRGGPAGEPELAHARQVAAEPAREGVVAVRLPGPARLDREHAVRLPAEADAGQRAAAADPPGDVAVHLREQPQREAGLRLRAQVGAPGRLEQRPRHHLGLGGVAVGGADQPGQHGRVEAEGAGQHGGVGVRSGDRAGRRVQPGRGRAG